MPHSILGVDVGYRSVKVAVFQAGFRQLELSDLFEVELPPSDQPQAVRAGQALGGLIEEQGLGDATLYVAFPGDRISVRLLQLPFSDARKIDQVVGFEMESQMLWDIDEVILDHAIAETLPQGGSRIIAAAAQKQEVAAFLEGMAQSGIEPRALFAAPLVYGALAERMAEQTGTSAILDVDMAQTRLCVLRAGRVLLGRTFACGAAVAESGQARNALLREMRQSLALLSAEYRTPVDRIFLMGESGKLHGLGEALQSELAVEVVSVEGGLETCFEPIPGGVDPPAHMALAVAVGLAGSTGRREIDFRRDEFAYKADFSFLRAKAAYFLVCLVGVLISAAFAAGAAHWRFAREKTRLGAELRTATLELFGTEVSDPEAVSSKLKQGIKMDELPVPAATAYDLLVQISSKIPPGDKLKLDITELEIKPKKTFLKGTVDSATAVDLIKDGLATITCFQSNKEDLIQKGAITNLPGQQGELKQFTLTIASKCP